MRRLKLRVTVYTSCFDLHHVEVLGNCNRLVIGS